MAGKKRSALTKEQLAEFRGTLSGKDHFGLDREHAKAHDACKLAHAVPPASYIQKLVTVWKVMCRRAAIRSR